jgi:hypothetical protein
MSREIYKYRVQVKEIWHEVAMPSQAKIVHVACQDTSGVVSLWAEIENESASVTRSFRIYGTGQSIPDDTDYVGTALDGMFVWHVYEKAARK